SRTPASRRCCPAIGRSRSSSGSSSPRTSTLRRLKDVRDAVSDEGANGVLAVPAEARSVEPSEHLLECAPELDQLGVARQRPRGVHVPHPPAARDRSEEHTSELQSRGHLVCRLLLEKKKKKKNTRKSLPIYTTT